MVSGCRRRPLTDLAGQILHSRRAPTTLPRTHGFRPRKLPARRMLCADSPHRPWPDVPPGIHAGLGRLGGDFPLFGSRKSLANPPGVGTGLAVVDANHRMIGLFPSKYATRPR